MEERPFRHRSLIVNAYSGLIEFSNQYLTLSKWFIKGDKDVFYRLEKLLLGVMAISIVVLLTLHKMPSWLAIGFAVLLFQRVFEFIIVYSRNFIFHRGRVFTDFKDPQQQGEWLIMMFSLNILQVIIIFSIWYRLLALLNENAFEGTMTILNSLYFSVVTFLTVGYGDILPVSPLAKGLVLFQSALTFYTLVIVVNGLISIHFRKG